MTELTPAFVSLCNGPASLVQQMLNEGFQKNQILTQLVSIAESLSGDDTTVSILVLNDEGLLCNGASPKLPADYLAAIDRLKPDANLGTCASAAATGEVVYTLDFFADDKWAELRHLPLSLGYKGAWSQPIKNSEGKVLGTFGTYFRSSRLPTPEEQKLVRSLAEAAALVL